MCRAFLFGAKLHLISKEWLVLRNHVRVEQIVKLIELWHDDDAGTAVDGTVFRRVIGRQSIELSAAGCNQAVRIDLVSVLQYTHYRRGTLYTQIPIVLDTV